ncbi:MAG: 23S rRNA (uracil-5-)-methyltransferase RumA [Bacteroidetes bacterium 37-13]|nr:MAG: 23S rRNA (uracil-5-)-methyltransferase RumA [Bacteroidetes bacterium 37-13]
MKQVIIETVRITGISAEGFGIGKLDNGKVVFVPYTAPGDLVKVQIAKSKKSFCEANLVEVLENSTERENPVCVHFGVCGGCKLQHINYSEQLRIKTQTVRDAFERIGKISTNGMSDIIGCENGYDYRNKLEFTFTNRKWLTNEEIASGETFERRALGFHVPGSFSGVLDIEKCWLMDESNAIRVGIKNFALEHNYSFFNIKEKVGLLRNLLIRKTETGELLTLISFFENDKEKIARLMDFVQSNFPQITSLQYVINPKANDTIYDLEPVVVKGNSFITEMLGEYKFRVAPKSFFQTNSVQAKKLYDVTKDFAELTGNENVFDLYTGVGSIAIYVSQACKQVVGIEQIDAAIEDAKQNAALNNIENVHFYGGDVRLLLNEELLQKHGKPDVIITDPPRAGMHEDVVKTLLEAAVEKIVYVSCNPATQARDLSLLNEKYFVAKIQPVDMFPQTMHIENVVLLKLKR